MRRLALTSATLAAVLAAGCGGSAAPPAAAPGAASGPGGAASGPAGSGPGSGGAGPAPATDPAAAPVGPGTLVSLPVAVPAALRHAPFDTGRRLSVPTGWTAADADGSLLVTDDQSGTVYRLSPPR